MLNAKTFSLVALSAIALSLSGCGGAELEAPTTQRYSVSSDDAEASISFDSNLSENEDQESDSLLYLDSGSSQNLVGVATYSLKLSSFEENSYDDASEFVSSLAVNYPRDYSNESDLNTNVYAVYTSTSSTIKFYVLVTDTHIAWFEAFDMAKSFEFSDDVISTVKITNN